MPPPRGEYGGAVERPRAFERSTWARLGTESGLARISLGVVALHVVDDSFLQPQPGISPGDHVVSGLVPTAVLLVAAWAYPRLRAGVRATLALVLGLFGVVSGVEAVYYTAKAGPSGDDFTGLPALAAGVLLVGIGVVTLWGSRRREGGRALRYGRRALFGLGAVAALFFVLVPLYLSYVFTHVARGVVSYPELGAPHEEVAFRTSDDLRLRGWYVPSRNRAAVIAFPGRKGPQRQTRMLVRHGYGVLLFDRRGEGESEGDPNIFGWEGERDVHAAVDFLRGRPDVDAERIGGVGLSVGGEMMIEAAAESDGLRAVVSEGAGIRSLREALLLEGASKLESVQFAFFTVGTALFSNDPPPPSLEDLVRRIAPRPLFLVYATHGQGGEELNPTFYEAAGEPKEIWEMETASHTGGIEAEPEEYERRVVGFFGQALLGPVGMSR